MIRKVIPMLPTAVSLAVILFVGASHAKALALRDVRDKPDEWFSSEEGKQVIANILIAQLPDGGWRKGYDLLDAENHHPADAWAMGSIDNGTTFTEMRLLSRAHRLTGRKDAADAFNRGLDYLFSAVSQRRVAAAVSSASRLRPIHHLQRPRHDPRHGASVRRCALAAICVC